MVIATPLVFSLASLVLVPSTWAPEEQAGHRSLLHISLPIFFLATRALPHDVEHSQLTLTSSLYFLHICNSPSAFLTLHSWSLTIIAFPWLPDLYSLSLRSDWNVPRKESDSILHIRSLRGPWETQENVSNW